MENPWGGKCNVREGRSILAQGDDRTIQFKTRPGGIYIIEPADKPLSEYHSAAFKDQPNSLPGLPGRDQ